MKDTYLKSEDEIEYMFENISRDSKIGSGRPGLSGFCVGFSPWTEAEEEDPLPPTER